MKRKESVYFLFVLLTIFYFLLGGVKTPFSVEELLLEGYISQPSFSPSDANTIACFSLKKDESSLILLDLRKSKKQGKTLFTSQRQKLFPNPYSPIRWSPSGDALLFLANSIQPSPSLIPRGTIWLINLPSGKQSAITESEDFFSPSFSPDGKIIASLRGTPNNASLWLYERGKGKWKLELEGLKANCLTWSKDGKFIYIGGDEGIYEVIWDKPKPEAKFFPIDKRIISLYHMAEGVLLASVFSHQAQFAPGLLPVSGADIFALELEGKGVKEGAITRNGASFNPVLFQRGMLVYIRNTPLLDDKGTLKGVVSSLWSAVGEELLAPYCDGDSLPSLSSDGRLLAFTKEGKLCLINIEKLTSSLPSMEEGDKELSQKVNQMKQIGLALLMYCQDYDETFPPAENFYEALYPYLKNELILSIFTDPHFHYYSPPPLIDIHHPSETLLARWEVSPGLFINLYVDGHVSVEEGGEQ
ncbi:PD40 domain-containing protein [bacterium]|nr:PD40 domain-containing protein [bacterium]